MNSWLKHLHRSHNFRNQIPPNQHKGKDCISSRTTQVTMPIANVVTKTTSQDGTVKIVTETQERDEFGNVLRVISRKTQTTRARKSAPDDTAQRNMPSKVTQPKRQIRHDSAIVSSPTGDAEHPLIATLRKQSSGSSKSTQSARELRSKPSRGLSPSSRPRSISDLLERDLQVSRPEPTRTASSRQLKSTVPFSTGSSGRNVTTSTKNRKSSKSNRSSTTDGVRGVPKPTSSYETIPPEGLSNNKVKREKNVIQYHSPVSQSSRKTHGQMITPVAQMVPTMELQQAAPVVTPLQRPTSHETSSLYAALQQAGLMAYADRFTAEGIQTAADALLLSDNDFSHLGINMGQRNRLRELLRPSQPVPRTPVTHTLPQSTTTQYTIPAPMPPNSKSSTPTGAERAKYNQMFDAFDTDRSGEVDLREFIAALKKLNAYHGDIEARRFFDEGDLDGGGTLDRQEFILLIHSAVISGSLGSQFAQLVESGAGVLEKLSQSSGVALSHEEVMKAPITDEALNACKKYLTHKKFAWVPEAADCNTDQVCELFWKVLIVDADASRQVVQFFCMRLLSEFDDRLRASGVSGFVEQVRVSDVVDNALSVFSLICHRYAHTTTHDKSYLASTEGMSFINSFRKAAVVISSELSVQQVRDKRREDIAEQQALAAGKRLPKRRTERGNDGKSVALKIAAKVAVLTLSAAVQIASNSCTIM